MTNSEARQKVESLRNEKRKEKYIRESHDLLIYNKQGGIKKEPYPRTRKIDIYHDNRKEKR